MSKRLGWLGPAIVIAGAAIAGVGVWYMVSAKPVAGAVIDTIPVDRDRSLVVRAEVGGDHDFIELHDHDIVRWQAFIPKYAGRPGAPGIAWSPIAVSIRVVRDGRAEIFAVAMSDASKLGGMGLAPDHGPIIVQTSGPVTLTDHIRTYEIVAGPDWHQLVAIELATGKALWKAELGPAEVTDGGVTDVAVWIAQAGQRRRFEIHSGRELAGNATL
jgi:hypothetical protein